MFIFLLHSLLLLYYSRDLCDTYLKNNKYENENKIESITLNRVYKVSNWNKITRGRLYL